jgi:hypothetical protein
MTNTEKIAALAQIIATNPAKAEFCSSMIKALAKGNPTPKQTACIERLLNEVANPVPALSLPALIGAFRAAAQSVKFPKVVVVTGETEWTLAYVSPNSEKAKPENRDTIGIASGKFGEPTAKWGGRIAQDGSVMWGKDATPDLVAAVQGIDPSALPLKGKK